MRVGRDSQQDVFEIVERRDVDQLAALDERIQQRRAARALETAREEPILPTDRDDAELIFSTVVIDRQASVLDKPLQGCPLIREIAR